MISSPRFIDPDTVVFIDLMPGVTTKVLSGLAGEKMMMVLTTIGPGVTVPSHRHPHEQVGIVYSGKASLRIEDEKRIVGEKDIYSIPANKEHEATAVGEDPFVAFEIFCPVRDDLIEKVRRSMGHRSE